MPRFKGYFPFKVLFEQGMIAPNYTAIRVMYSGAVDIGYYVNKEGLLEQIGVDNPIPLKPEEVLSEEKNPDGWEPGLLRPRKKQTKRA